MSSGSQADRWQRFAAGLVHLFTGLGALLAFFAVLALEHRAFEIAFAWLAVALVVDGLDGPLARWLAVGERLPRFSGERLDLIIDYMTYAFIPALALRWAGYLPGWWGLVLAAAILLSALYHFSDLQSKTDENYFVGFPALWNVVAFFLFAFAASLVTTSIVILGCAALTFVPIRTPHPLRVTAFRPLTLVVLVVGLAAAVWVLVAGFPANLLQGGVLLACLMYFAALPSVARALAAR